MKSAQAMHVVCALKFKLITSESGCMHFISAEFLLTSTDMHTNNKENNNFCLTKPPVEGGRPASDPCRPKGSPGVGGSDPCRPIGSPGVGGSDTCRPRGSPGVCGSGRLVEPRVPVFRDGSGGPLDVPFIELKVFASFKPGKHSTPCRGRGFESSQRKDVTCTHTPKLNQSCKRIVGRHAEPTSCCCWN